MDANPARIKPDAVRLLTTELLEQCSRKQIEPAQACRHLYSTLTTILGLWVTDPEEREHALDYIELHMRESVNVILKNKPRWVS